MDIDLWTKVVCWTIEKNKPSEHLEEEINNEADTCQRTQMTKEEKGKGEAKKTNLALDGV